MTALQPTIPPALGVIQYAIDTIEEQLDRVIELESLAVNAGMSFWHFFRLFRTTVGETPKDYIRRRRLTLAAYALLETNRSVLDIALAAGFESNESFSRAFRIQFDISPRAFRAAGQPPIFPRAHLSVTSAYLAHLHHGISREPELVDHPALRLVGVKAELTVAPADFDLLVLGAPLWNEFVALIDSIGQRVDDKAILVCDILASNEQHIRCEIMHAVVVSDFGGVPPHCVTQVRSPCRDAVFKHQGTEQAWEYSMQYVFGVWLPESNYVLSELPVLYRFNVGASPFSSEPDLELWLPLSP